MKKVYQVTIIVLLVLLAGSIIFGVRGHRRELVYKININELHLKYKRLQKSIRRSDSLIVEKDKLISRLNLLLSEKVAQEEKIKSDLKQIKTKYETLLREVSLIPADSSYAFLRSVAYPYEGKPIYPFNRTQVKEMHLTYIKYKGLEEMKSKMDEEVINLTSSLRLKDTLVLYLTQKNRYIEKKYNDCERIVKSKDREIRLMNTDRRKERRRKNTWKIAGITTAAVLTILLIFR